MGEKSADDARENTSLAEYLKSVRRGLDLSLREVEELTEKEVSNAYLSQLENAKILKPSPHVLYALSEAYRIPYDGLMEKAGYIAPSAKRHDNQKHGRAATFAIDNLTKAEETALLEHLAFVRWSKK